MNMQVRNFIRKIRSWFSQQKIEPKKLPPSKSTRSKPQKVRTSLPRVPVNKKSEQSLNKESVEMAKDKKFIQKAIKHPGALHKDLGVPEGKNIPAKKLEKATHSKNPTVKKRAVFAETLKKMHK